MSAKSTGKPEKIHLGLITTQKAHEAAYKDALQQMGGGYVHSAKDHLEMNGKLMMQKIDMLVYECPPQETGASVQAMLGFFRSKRDYQSLPIGIIYPGERLEMKNLITDVRVRGFSSTTGPFLAIVSLQPFLGSKTTAKEEALPQAWIEREFLASIKSKAGETVDFTPAPATDDDLHTGFLCQVSQEVRSHLAWVKIAARILEQKEEGFSKMFQGISKDLVENVAESLLKQICQDFDQKLTAELVTRGALFFPEMESMSPVDRKTIYSGSQSTAFIFKSEQIAILLEMIRYF